MLDYGAAGYGLYWYCVELIAKNVSPTNITFELEHDARIIARNLNLSVQETKDMMQKMVDLGLFDINTNNKITCLSIAYRLDDSMRKGRQVDEIVKKFNDSEKSRKIPDDSRKSLLDTDTDTDTDTELNTIDTNVSIVVNGETIPDCPHQEIISLYKKNIPMGIQPKAWDGARAVALKSRWRERKERQDLAWWDKFFDYVSQSKFLTGQVVAKDRKPFEITLPWLLKPENFNKIIEGYYHR
jgi:hypothetical protein